MMDSIVILGPTASGKTKLAVALAKTLDAEILSIDSRQVFKGMDIGTGKDLEEYQGVKHHLIDILEAGEDIHLYEFQKQFDAAFRKIKQDNKLAIIVGGTPLYLDAILKGHQYSSIPNNHALRDTLDTLSTEELLNTLTKYSTSYNAIADTSTRKRIIRAIEICEHLAQNPNFELPNFIKPKGKIYGIDLDAETRRQRINHRLEHRLKNGLIEEVEQLLQKGISAEKLIFYGLEYKFVVAYLNKQLSYNDMQQQLQTAIHQFAKRQMTYFRKMERAGLAINWLDGKQLDTDYLIEAITS